MKLAKKSIALRTLTRGGFGLLLLVIFAGPIALLAIIPIALIVGAYEYLYWQNFEFDFEGDDLKISSGVITKNDLDIPVRRIQDIDTSQHILARVFGVVQVDVQTAGGDTSSNSLRYLEVDQAEHVKQRLRELKDRRESTDEPDDRHESAELFYDIGDSLITYSLLRSVPAAIGTAIVAGLVGIGVAAYLATTPRQMLGLGALAIAGAFGVGILVFVTGFIGGYLQYYDFRVERRNDVFEYERGLLSKKGGTIPKEKIQHVEISENFLMRHLGYATLKVETAGVTRSSETGTTSTTVLMPFERTETVYKRAETLGEFQADSLDIDGLTDIGPIAKQRYTRRYLLLSTVLLVVCGGLVGAGFHPGIFLVPLVGFVLASPGARRQWEHIGYRRGTHNMVVSRGFWVRTTYLVPHFRIQNLMVSQSLFQRRWGVGTVTVDTAGNKAVNPTVPDLARQTAFEWRATLYEAFRESMYATPADGTGSDQPDATSDEQAESPDPPMECTADSSRPERNQKQGR